ncbi:hypothetical protein ZWY2020_010054 [Hordeum vulgare]|nr:hypothetical protein ZWY2020_010054 [Hordeum vulgare]
MAKRFREAQSGGSIVCLTQIIGAERGLYPRAAAYATSLGVVHQLVRLWAMELRKHKIRVNAVCHVLHLGDKFRVSVGEEKAEKATGEERCMGAAMTGQGLKASTGSVSIVYTMIGDVCLYIVGKDEYDELARECH